MTRINPLACFVAALVLQACPVAAQAQTLPLDAGLVNVRDFGASGDGMVDDTDAIRRAIAAARVDQGKVFWPARVVYLPAGIYRVSDSLWSKGADGLYRASMALVGDGIDATRIVLADASPGFGNANEPKAIVYASSGLLGGAPNAGGKDYEGKGEGNDAYGNYVERLTIDTGRRNPGAIAIDFLASNVGAVRHVRLSAAPDSGHTALSMNRKWPGPLLITDVRIEGYTTGIALGNREYGVTLEGVRLVGQRSVAVRNEGNALSARRLLIDGSATSLVNVAAEGLAVIDDLTLIRPAGAMAAWLDNRGYLTLKNVHAQTPDGKVADTPPNAADGAYFSAQRLAGYSAAWQLPVLQAPVAPVVPAARWVSVARYGARPDTNEDSTAAIRAAMNSGAEVIYFPSGRYRISDAIEVPAKVRRIEGFYSSLRVLSARAAGFSREYGMLRVREDGEPLTVSRLALDNMEQGPQSGVEHSSPRAVVLRDLISAGVELAHRTATGGPLFLENVCCGTLRLEGPQGVWARQFNTEGGGVRVLNDGAPFSVLGLKAEQNCTVVQSRNGARTDIVGGLVYLVNPPVTSVPAFTVESRASMSASYAESAYRDGAVYREHIVWTDAAGNRQVLADTALPKRGMARLVPGVAVSASQANLQTKR
jgi:Pectate lyase superfamily protein